MIHPSHRVENGICVACDAGDPTSVVPLAEPCAAVTSPRELPTVGDYTVDARLREFRRVYRTADGPRIEFVAFDSRKGKRLLRKWEKEAQSWLPL